MDPPPRPPIHPVEVAMRLILPRVGVLLLETTLRPPHPLSRPFMQE